MAAAEAAPAEVDAEGRASSADGDPGHEAASHRTEGADVGDCGEDPTLRKGAAAVTPDASGGRGALRPGSGGRGGVRLPAGAAAEGASTEASALPSAVPPSAATNPAARSPSLPGTDAKAPPSHQREAESAGAATPEEAFAAAKSATATETETELETGEKRPGGNAEEEAAPPVSPRPVKRARTAYFIFADERRAQVAQEHPGQGVAAVGKALGALWSSLTPAERQPYQDRAAEERARVVRDLAEWTQRHPAEAAAAAAAAASSDVPPPDDPLSLVFPVAKVRKICKLDPDVRNLTKEAVALIAKAAEAALQKLGRESVSVASIQNRRKLLPDDVALVCETREQFHFLREDLADLHRLQQRERELAAVPQAAASSEAASASARTAHPEKATASKPKGASKKGALPASSKPLTAYFAADKPKAS